MPDWNVDICFTILSDQPPKLPLREELNSLGFEVIYATPGTGIKAAKHQSKRNVEKFRRRMQYIDLKKRRIIPKSPKKIKEKIAERKRIEQDLGLPHACSYESYGKELIGGDSSTSSSDTSHLSYDEKRAKKRWGLLKRRQKQNEFLQPITTEGKDPSDFRKIAAEAIFPDFLAPFYALKTTAVSTEAAEQDHRDRWKDAFAALDALSDGESRKASDEAFNKTQTFAPQGVANESGDSSSKPFTSDASAVYHATHVDDHATRDGRESGQPVNLLPEVDEVIEGVDSGTTCVFDGIETAGSHGAHVCTDANNLVMESDFNAAPNTYLAGMEEEKKEDVQLIKPKVEKPKKPKKEKAEKASKPATGNAFHGVSLELYNKVGADGEAVKNEAMPIAPDLNFDHSHAAELAAGGGVQLQEKPESQNIFATVSAEFYQAVGMGSPESDKDKMTFGVASTGDVRVSNGAAKPEAAASKPAQDVKGAPLSPFDRATAEICKAVGIEHPTVMIGGKDESHLSDKTVKEWVSSAKQVLDSFSHGAFKAAGLYRQEEEAQTKKPSHATNGPSKSLRAPKPERANEAPDISVLFTVLSRPDTPPKEVQRILNSYPELLQVRRHQDGRLPLHALCDRDMPNRSSLSGDKLAKRVLKDIASYKRVIAIVSKLYPDACLIQDKKEDLPIHLLARNLMQWEATWYEVLYKKAAEERSAPKGTAIAITQLYHSMSESVEMVLRPIVENIELRTSLCRAPGSMGTILPLHIAVVFTVSVMTLRLILEANPEAAARQCDLGILQTYVPDECLPLELHDNLSTDFPKWEIESQRETTMENGELETNSEDCIRRSDLLFAYNPIEPHRLEKARIRRIVSRIQFDATVVVGKSSKKLNRAHELLWVWMCTFREKETGRSTYANSVKRIVSTLPLQSLQHLASVQTENGELVVDAASPECLKFIQRRLEHITEPGQADLLAGPSKSIDLNGLISQENKELVGQICRSIFNVPVTPYPTSFVVLPYRLSIDDDGALGLASPVFSSVATEFATCLLNMTDPRSVLFALDAKSARHFHQSLYDSADKAFYLEAEARMKGYEKDLLALYESGLSYLYLIDEITGLPNVVLDDPIYPIVLSNASDLVRKLLPLMMMGMVQMRGDKSIPKLIDVLLDKQVAAVPPSWEKAAKMLVLYLESQRACDSLRNTGLAQTKHSLQALLASYSSTFRRAAKPKNGVSEWSAELSILKMLLEMNDKDRTYSGLPIPVVSAQAADLVVETTESQEMLEEEIEPKIIGLSRKMEKLSRLQRLQGRPVPVPAATEHAAELVVFTTQAHELLEEEIEPEIDDLSRKMEELSRLQRETTFIPHQETPVELVQLDSSSYEDDLFLKGKTFSEEGEYSGAEVSGSEAANGLTGRKRMLSRYSMLFNDLALQGPEVEKYETRDDAESDLKVWNASERVWEDVSCQLNKRAETFCEDTQILQLKVALAEQAQKLAQLGKKVSSLKDEERRLFSHADMIHDLSKERETEPDFASARDSLSDARKLVIRMCDLEERLVCDEIKIQHLSMEAYNLEYEGGEMTLCYGDSRPSKFRPEHTSFLTITEFDGAQGPRERPSSRFGADKKESKVVRFNESRLEYDISTSSEEPSTRYRSQREYSSSESSASASVYYLMTVGGDIGNGRTPAEKSSRQDRATLRTSATDTEISYDNRETISTPALRSISSDFPPTAFVRFSPTQMEESARNAAPRLQFPPRSRSGSARKYAPYDRESPPTDTTDESAVSEVTGGAESSTESVFRRSRPIRTLAFDGQRLPSREYSGLTDRSDSNDLSVQQNNELATKQNGGDIDNVISRYTTEACEKISRSAEWMKDHGLSPARSEF